MAARRESAPSAGAGFMNTVTSNQAALASREWLRDKALMPTLFRFLAFIAILGGLAFAGATALVLFVEPQPREMSIVVPPGKLGK
jgi:hypothetical protein